MKTIHLIASAHLDPIWLWPWQNGLDAILNTCRTMVRFLERHPEVIFSCGEAWKYRQVQELAPKLFEQIRALVHAGRWEVVGGWWIQPDCNAPSGFAMQRQIELGQRYFRETFGEAPRIAFNVDSFGHAATLPGYMHAAGQTGYVMMRPQEHEMTLPARMFRWRGYEDGPAIPTFRIADGYGDFNRMSEHHVRASLVGLPEGIEHTMCFVGVGDHGGGPNERLMAWLAEHRSAFSDVRLIWSSPSRFFAAIQKDLHKLLIVTGELQHHAVGCYSVYRPVKVAVRQAEHLLAQAETLAAPADRDALDNAWKTVCFHHFHDTLGGTCIPSAYQQVQAELGGAQAFADRLLQTALRRKVLDMPADPHHRIVLHNASDRSFAGYTTWEYWFGDGGKWEAHWRLLDEAGNVVPHQLVMTEAVQVTMQCRLLFRIQLGAGETRVLRVDRNNVAAESPFASSLAASATQLVSPGGGAIDLGSPGQEASITLHGISTPLPRLVLVDDPTDTWSHGVDHFAETPVAELCCEPPTIVDAGPLMTAIVQRATIGASPVLFEYRVYRDEPFVEVLLRMEWVQRHQVLKLIWPTPGKIAKRQDGIMGGILERQPDGAERPMRDYTLLEQLDGTRLGIACPDVYAFDCTPDRVRFTLLRGAMMAHHEPAIASDYPRARPADVGFHEFRFRFYAGKNLNIETLEDAATAMQRPLLLAETTDGMPPI